MAVVLLKGRDQQELLTNNPSKGAGAAILPQGDIQFILVSFNAPPQADLPRCFVIAIAGSYVL